MSKPTNQIKATIATTETLSPAHKSLFAYVLYRAFQNRDMVEGELPLTSVEEDMERWRNDEALRRNYTDLADCVIGSLQAMSLRVRPISSAKADAAFTELVTIPARKAYDL